jgi:hypothetical protein
MMYDNLSNLELIKILKSLESNTEDAVRKRVEVFIRNERKLQSVLWEIIQLLVSIVERKRPLCIVSSSGDVYSCLLYSRRAGNVQGTS